jgi:tight adherence protein B
MNGMVLGACAATGVAMIVTAPSRRAHTGASRSVRAGERLARWMLQAGIPDVAPVQFASVTAVVAIAGAVITYAVFGGPLAALGVGLFAGAMPAGAYRVRRRAHRAAAADAWPSMIEEIRVLTGPAGRSIPRALIEVGLRGPEDMRPAFRAAQREWTVTTDFARTTALLKDLLDSGTADVVCETLLVANELGGVDLDRRLAELAEDRRRDAFARRDAVAKQAGVRFARRFVIIVPVGMALAGMSLGDGRAAYETAIGQALVAAGVAMVAVCWIWSGRMLRLPDEPRVFP